MILLYMILKGVPWDHCLISLFGFPVGRFLFSVLTYLCEL